MQAYIFFVYFKIFNIIYAYTHWIVTENGIQAQVDSVCALKKPYDLVTFLEQEQRMHLLEKLKVELLDQKLNLDISTDVKDLSDIDKWFYKKDQDCRLAEKPLIQIDLFVSTIITPESIGIDQNDYIPFYSPNKSPSKPDCSQITDLSFGNHMFDHLESLQKGAYLTIPPENSIKSALPFVDSVTEYGHLINEALLKNRTSWILYDMATFYWRIKGEANKAIECVRRSLHYSPDRYKPIALVNLANVLNRAGNPGDALEVLEYAQSFKLYEDFLIPYMIGNVLALLTNYTESIVAFRQALKLRPNFQPAIQRLHAVLCHNKLIQALEDQHNSLQKTLNHLQDFQKKHETWTRLYEKISSEMVPLDLRLQQLAVYEDMITKYESESAPSDDETLRETLKNQDDASGPDINTKEDAITVTRNLPQEFYTHQVMDAPIVKIGRRNHKLIFGNQDVAADESVEDEFGTESTKSGSRDRSPPSSSSSAFLAGSQKVAATRKRRKLRQSPSATLLADRRTVIESELSRLRVSSGSSTTFLDENECHQLFKHFLPLELKAVPSEPAMRRPSYSGFFSSYFIPAEHKGWADLAPLLNENQGIDPLSTDPKKFVKQHPLPWKPPVCSDFGKIDCRVANCYQEVTKVLGDKLDAYQTVMMQSKVRETDPDLAKILLSYIDTVNEPTEDEVGQRILTAFKMGNEKNWAMYNMASLYWRTIGNITQALECLHRSFYYCPQKYTVVPLLNMASLLATSLRAYDQSLVLLKEAHGLDVQEPAITMLMAHLLYLTGNLTGAWHFYKETLLLDAPTEAPHSINKEALIGYELVGCRLAFPDKYNEISRIKRNELKNPDYMDPLDRDIYGAEPDDLTFSSSMITFETFHLSGVDVSMEGGNFDDITEPVTLSSKHGVSHRTPSHHKSHYHQHPDPGYVSNIDHDKEVIFNIGNLKKMNQNFDEGRDKDSFSSIQVELKDPRNYDGVPDFKIPNIDEYAEDCLDAVAIDFTNLPSTWISLPQKYLDALLPSSQSQDALELTSDFTVPICESTPVNILREKDVAKDHYPSSHTYDHIEGDDDAEMSRLIYHPLATIHKELDNVKGIYNNSEPQTETGLLTVLKKILKIKLAPYSQSEATPNADLNIMGKVLAKLMQDNRGGFSHWISTALASLYWRIQGNVSQSLHCMENSLRHTPRPYMDSGLVGLGTVLQRIGHTRLAVVAIQKALEISPKAVIIHFTMANILAAQGDFTNAILYYGSTLALQDFVPAKVKLQSILCLHNSHQSEHYKDSQIKDEL